MSTPRRATGANHLTDLVISCIDEERYKLFDEIHYDNSLSLSLPKSAGYLAAVFILVPKPTTQLRTLC